MLALADSVMDGGPPRGNKAILNKGTKPKLAPCNGRDNQAFPTPQISAHLPIICTAICSQEWPSGRVAGALSVGKKMSERSELFFPEERAPATRPTPK